MAKRFTSDEILQMAVGLIPKDMEADLDLDGKITASDARYVKRQEEGKLPLDTPSMMAENIAKRILKENSSFSYDPEGDPLLSQYKKQYEKEGQRASEDIMGRASALTGGYGNSYGSKIAADKMAEFSEMSADKASELEERAYKRHKDSIESLYSLYSLMTDEAKKEDDRKKAALDFAVLASEMGDDSFIKELGIDPEDDDFKKLKEQAELFAKYGDYSGLRELGIDTSALESGKRYELAELFAKYGDYSLLGALGVDTSRLTDEDKITLAELFAKYGDYSKLNQLGADTKNRELEEYYDRLLKKQKVW